MGPIIYWQFACALILECRVQSWYTDFYKSPIAVQFWGLHKERCIQAHTPQRACCKLEQLTTESLVKDFAVHRYYYYLVSTTPSLYIIMYTSTMISIERLLVWVVFGYCKQTPLVTVCIFLSHNVSSHYSQFSHKHWHARVCLTYRTQNHDTVTPRVFKLPAVTQRISKFRSSVNEDILQFHPNHLYFPLPKIHCMW